MVYFQTDDLMVFLVDSGIPSTSGEVRDSQPSRAFSVTSEETPARSRLLVAIDRSRLLVWKNHLNSLLISIGTFSPAAFRQSSVIAAATEVPSRFLLPCRFGNQLENGSDAEALSSKSLRSDERGTEMLSRFHPYISMNSLHT